MKNKIIIIPLMLILCVGFVTGASPSGITQADFIVVTDNATDLTGQLTPTQNGIDWSSTLNRFGETYGDYSDAGDYLDLNWQLTGWGDEGVTIVVTFKSPDDLGNDIIYGGFDNTDSFYFDSNLNGRLVSSGATNLQWTTNIAGSWMMAINEHFPKRTQWWTWINGTVLGDNDTYGASMTDLDVDLSLGCGSWPGICDAGPGQWDGDIGSICIFNNSDTPLTECEREYLDDNGCKQFYLNLDTLCTPAAPVITFVYPTDGLYYSDYDGWINYTTDEAANCTLNNTDWIYNDSLSNSSDHFYRNPTSLANGNYTINFSCWDSGNLNDSTIINFGIDETFPNIKSSLSENNTIAYDNLTFQFNFSDNHLIFRVNISAQEYNYTLANINTSFWQVNGSIFLQNYSTGLHEINVEYCDAHTDKEKKKADISINQFTKNLEFGYNGKTITILPKNPSHFDTVWVDEEFDRYKFTYNKKDSYKNKEETYYVSGYDLQIIGDDEFQGWIVDSQLNKWIDFETSQKHKATVKRISKNMVEVRTAGEMFESVGDLNCKNATYEFYKFNYSITYNTTTLEGATDRYTLELNISGLPTITARTGILTVNYSQKATTITNLSNALNMTGISTTSLSSATSITQVIFFNYSLNGFVFNTQNYTQTINQMYLDGCGGITNTTTLNFTLFDEITKYEIASDFKGYFEVGWLGSTVLRNYTFNFTTNHTHEICIFPSTSLFYADFITQYETEGYSTRNYIRRNHSIDGVYELIKLYLLSSANSTSVTVSTVNDLDEPLSDYLVEMYFFDLETGNLTLVETGVTNSGGETIFNVLYNKAFYLFRFYEGTQLKLSDSSHFQITSLNLLYRIFGDVSTGLQRWIEIRDFEPAFSYDNETRKLNLSWGIYSASIATMNWEIQYTNGTEVISNKSTTENSYFVYTFPTKNETYSVTGFITDIDGKNFTVVDAFSLDLRLGSLWKQDPIEGIAIAILVVSVIGLLAYANPIAGIIGTVLGVFVVMFFGLIPFMKPELFGLIALAVMAITMMMRRGRTQ